MSFLDPADRRSRYSSDRTRRQRMRRPQRKSDYGWVAGLIVLVLIVLAIVSAPIVSYATRDHVTLRVTDKTVKRKDDHDQYLIFTDKGVYKDTDSLWMLKFNSSDVYGKLMEGHTYDCEVNGFRIPLFSHYKNIIDCEEVAQ